MIWEGQAGKAWVHVFRRDAFGDELIQCRCDASREKVGSEAIERYEDGGRSEVVGSVGEEEVGIGVRGSGHLVRPKGKDEEEEDDGDRDYRACCVLSSLHRGQSLATLKHSLAIPVMSCDA